MRKVLHMLRHYYLVKVKWRKYSFGKNVYIGRMVYLWARHKIVVGDNFYIGKFSQIECDAEIGNDVMMANQVALVGRYDHDFSQIGVPVRLASKIRDKNYTWKGLHLKTIIGDDVWIGHGSIILSGINIGQGSIIAAGSVVTCDVEPFCIYAGNPARKIKQRFEKEEDKLEHIRIYSQKPG